MQSSEEVITSGKVTERLGKVALTALGITLLTGASLLLIRGGKLTMEKVNAQPPQQNSASPYLIAGLIHSADTTSTLSSTLFLPIIHKPEQQASYAVYPDCNHIGFVGPNSSNCTEGDGRAVMHIQRRDTGFILLKDILALQNGVIEFKGNEIWFRDNPGVLDSKVVFNIAIKKGDGRVIYGIPVSMQDVVPLDTSLGIKVFNPVTKKFEVIHRSSLNGTSSGGITPQLESKDKYDVNISWDMPALRALKFGDEVYLTVYNDGNEATHDLWVDTIWKNPITTN